MNMHGLYETTLVCEYWYCVLLSSIVVVPTCYTTDIFVCEPTYMIELNLNHAHHRDTYKSSTHIFACKRTYQ